MSTIEFLPLTGLSGNQVPYLRRNQPTTTSVISMNPQDKTRLVRYEECWRFYQGLQWGFTRDDGDPLITANIARVIVHKLASWLVGNGMDLSTTEALSNVTLPVLKEVWEYNKKDFLVHTAAVMAGVTGDGFILITYQDPTSLERVIDPHTQGKIRIRLLPSHQVFPQWDPRNTERLRAVKIISEEADNRMPDIVPQQGAVEGVMTQGRQIRRYVETITPEWISEGYDDEMPVQRPNVLSEVPLVHWPNIPFPGEYYGMSDLDGIIDLQKELNQKLTDQSDIVHINASPITWVTGAKASQLEKGPRSLWTFANPQVKVGQLQGVGELGSIQKYIEFIMQMIYDISGVPEGSLGRIQSISNTSAAALEVQYGPLLEAVRRKALGFIEGIKQINYFILRFYQVIRKEMFPTNICSNCGGGIIEFPVVSPGGITRIIKKCYIINPQTLDFMNPEDVRVRVRRQFSFGQTTQEVPFKQAKLEFGKKSTSYWDPAPEKDLQREAEAKAEQAQAAQDEAVRQMQEQAAQEHANALELKGSGQDASQG